MALCVILGGGRGTRLFPLTKMRAKPAVPLGGKYRLIDVPISNCLNSGFNQIYVVTQFESTSLHRHLKGSYEFDRFGSGFIEVLAATQTLEHDHWYQGTADAVRKNLPHFHGNHQEILILSGDQLYHMDFRELLASHRRSKAEMSIAVLPVDAQSATSLGIVKVSADGQVNGFYEKPSADKLDGLETDPSLFDAFGITSGDRPYLASMGIYVFNRPTLYRELTENDHEDFGKHLFPACIGRCRVQAHLFDGYWEDIGTVGAFHEANLQLARVPAPFSFRTEHGMIYTRPRTLPGVVAARLEVHDSIVGDGCVVEEASLQESILGLRSIVGKDVHLKRTLVMGADFYETESEKTENCRLQRPNVGIGNNVVIENAIVDKNARIGSDVVIKNPQAVQPTETDMYVVRDGVICILKGATVASGTRIGV